MYSVYHKEQEYEVTEELYLQVGICSMQYRQALVVDKPLFIEHFKDKLLPKILASPKFDYSKLRDEELEGVVDTTNLVSGYEQ